MRRLCLADGSAHLLLLPALIERVLPVPSQIRQRRAITRLARLTGPVALVVLALVLAARLQEKPFSVR